MNKYRLAALSVSAGILSGFAWTGWCTGLILLISFVPFFIIENHLYVKQERYEMNSLFLYLLPGFVIFNIIAIGWVRAASITAAIVIIMGLSFIMSFSMWLAHLIRLRSGNIAGLISVIAFWLGYEFLSLRINVLTPWLNLGNGLSKDIAFIQWYDTTGSGGGTLWILLSNLLLTGLWLNLKKNIKVKASYLIAWILLITLPVLISVKKYYSVSENKSIGEEAVIIQPDIDPYTEKFTIPFDRQLKNVLSMAETGVTPGTAWIITPETTIDDPVDISTMNDNKYILNYRSFLQNHPGATFITGVVTYTSFKTSSRPTRSARKTDSSGTFIDHYNSALKIDTGPVIGVYHKSRLVPGIEMQFINSPGRLIARMLPQLGGTEWGYGIQKDRITFMNEHTKTLVAPIICYESIYGEYVTGYVRKGANALFIITNDGWWKNTAGYKQHLWYASLRAIETRRPVARAANTGISCFIDINGKRLSETEWWKPAVLKGTIHPETGMTAYVKYGDFILRISALISIIILLISFIAIPLRRKLRSLK